MSGFVEGVDRSQSSLFPAYLEDYVGEDNPVRAVDAFVEGLILESWVLGGPSRWKMAGPVMTVLLHQSKNGPPTSGNGVIFDRFRRDSPIGLFCLAPEANIS